MATAAPGPRPANVSIPSGLTYAEFPDWAGDGPRAEWRDGEIVLASPASKTHERCATVLAMILRAYTDRFSLEQVFAPLFQMKTAEEEAPGRKPDVLFVSQRNLARVKETFLDRALTGNRD